MVETSDCESESLSPKKREIVLARDGYECQWCGRVGQERFPAEAPQHQDEPVALNAHHKVPPRNGGSDKLENLITVCRRDHEKFHNNPASARERPASEREERSERSVPFNNPESTEAEVYKVVAAHGPVRTGQVADAVEVSKEHSRRLLYALGSRDLVLPTNDGGWDLPDRVPDPPIGELPKDPELAAARVRDELLRRAAELFGLDDGELAELADVSPRTARVAIDRAATYEVPLPDIGPGTSDESEVVSEAADGAGEVGSLFGWGEDSE